MKRTIYRPPISNGVCYFLSMSYLSDEQKQVIIRKELADWEAQKLTIEVQIEGNLAINSSMDVSALEKQVSDIEAAITKVSKRLE